jgi:hypothetical protein
VDGSQDDPVDHQNLSDIIEVYIHPLPYLEDAAAVAVAAAVVAAVVAAVAVARLPSVGGPGSSPCCGAW